MKILPPAFRRVCLSFFFNNYLNFFILLALIGNDETKILLAYMIYSYENYILLACMAAKRHTCNSKLQQHNCCINLGSAGYLPSCTMHPKVQHCEEWLLLRINLPLDCFSVTTAPNFVWVSEVGDQNGQHFLSLRNHVFRSGRTPHHFSPMCTYIFMYV